jgi:hypothetical protein
MRLPPQIQRLAGFLCLMLVLVLAFTPGVASHTFAILVVLWSFIPLAIIVQRFDVPDDNYPQQAPALPAFYPRPPPTL